AVLCQPLYRRCLKWTKDRTALAAGLTTLAVLIIILVPATLGTVAAARQLYALAQNTLKASHPKTSSDWNELARTIQDSAAVDALIRRYEEWTGETVNRDELQGEVQARLREGALVLARKTLGYAGSTLSLLGTVVSILIGGLTFVIAFYYFLAD